MDEAKSRSPRSEDELREREPEVMIAIPRGFGVEEEASEALLAETGAGLDELPEVDVARDEDRKLREASEADRREGPAEPSVRGESIGGVMGGPARVDGDVLVEAVSTWRR